MCYLCGEPVDDDAGSGDHVIPRVLLGDRPPKVKGFDYGGRVRAHLECNNRFGDETHVRKALQLLGALHDSRTTLTRPAPGRVKGHVLALNEATLPGFSRRDFRFFGIYDARNDSMARFDDLEYYTGKPRADLRKTVLCTSLSVLAKSAVALLVSRHLAELPGNWDIVCIPYTGDATEADLSSFFGEAKPFAPDIRVLDEEVRSCLLGFHIRHGYRRWRGSSSSWRKTAVWSKGSGNDSLASHAFGSRVSRSWIWSGTTGRPRVGLRVPSDRWMVCAVDGLYVRPVPIDWSSWNVSALRVSPPCWVVCGAEPGGQRSTLPCGRAVLSWRRPGWMSTFCPKGFDDVHGETELEVIRYGVPIDRKLTGNTVQNSTAVDT